MPLLKIGYNDRFKSNYLFKNLFTLRWMNQNTQTHGSPMMSDLNKLGILLKQKSFR
jgi:hypothetical protein